MLTKIDLCTMALLKLGEEPITSFSDNNTAAKLARTLFEPTINTLLAMHPWRFACKHIELTKDTNNKFIIPTECIRVLKCDGRVVGNTIVAPGNKTHIIAMTNVVPEQFPSYFIGLAATRLAMEFCIPLTGDQTVFRMLVALYESELKSAKFIDSTMSIGPDIDNFSLINVRF